MGRKPKLREIVCVRCGARAELWPPAAERSGWDLWLGGGTCPACKGPEKPPAPFPHPQPAPAGPTFVRCSSCGREPLLGIEITTGEFRPTFHWLTTEENKRKLREERIPIPMCRGVRQAGVVVPEPKGTTE